MQIDEDEYVNSFNPILIDVFCAWANGSNFSDICKMSDVFEGISKYFCIILCLKWVRYVGNIIRSIRRLEELLRQLASAASSIGNNELTTKFDECARRIRRGVVFTASLYL